MFPQFKHCESCGSPINSKDLCENCSNEDGSLKHYEEVLDNMINFMLSEEGTKMSGLKFNSYDDAKIVAEKYLKNMPEWKKE